MELELRSVGTKPGSSVRANAALDHRAIFSALVALVVQFLTCLNLRSFCGTEHSRLTSQNCAKYHKYKEHGGHGGQSFVESEASQGSVVRRWLSQ